MEQFGIEFRDHSVLNFLKIIFRFSTPTAMIGPLEMWVNIPYSTTIHYYYLLIISTKDQDRVCVTAVFFFLLPL